MITYNMHTTGVGSASQRLRQKSARSPCMGLHIGFSPLRKWRSRYLSTQYWLCRRARKVI
jgi:hypothetical protein